MRVYKDFDGHQQRIGDTPYAVDVSAVMTRCNDGSLIITALVIGGQLTPLDNRCPTTSKKRGIYNAPIHARRTAGPCHTGFCRQQHRCHDTC
jgi:hypothetical protein